MRRWMLVALAVLLGAYTLATAQQGPATLTPTKLVGQAGNGTAKLHPQGTLYWEYTNTANGADTNYVKTGTYVLPANTLMTAGDHLIVRTEMLLSAATSSKSYVCNVGFTAWTGAGGFSGGVNFNANATTNSTTDAHIQGELTWKTASTFNIWTNVLVGGSIQSTNFVASSGVDFTANQNIACEAKDGTGNAGAITIEEFRVKLHPR